MTRLVLDASVALSWAFDEEDGGYSDRVLDALVDGQAVVPALWGLEIANGLVAAERRGRLTEAASARFLALLQSLPIEVEELELHGLPQVVAVAREHGLTAYDASYLVVAMRRDLPLATLDRRLEQAARASGVALL